MKTGSKKTEEKKKADEEKKKEQNKAILLEKTNEFPKIDLENWIIKKHF